MSLFPNLDLDTPLNKEEVQESKKKSNDFINEKKMKKTKAQEELPNKPKINIDVDSVIVNDNIITDDEFFDDFFSDE